MKGGEKERILEVEREGDEGGARQSDTRLSQLRGSTSEGRAYGIGGLK